MGGVQACAPGQLVMALGRQEWRQAWKGVQEDIKNPYASCQLGGALLNIPEAAWGGHQRVEPGAPHAKISHSPLLHTSLPAPPRCVWTNRYTVLCEEI